MAEIFDNVSEGRCEPVLLCSVQFSALRGEIEDVDGDFAFSVNKCNQFLFFFFNMAHFLLAYILGGYAIRIEAMLST